MKLPPFNQVSLIPVSRIVRNNYNPNEMTTTEMELLVQNIREVGFVAPPVVCPFKKDGKWYFEIVDGEHRLAAILLTDAKEIPCWVVDPKTWTQEVRKKQTIRLNKIKGHLNPKKFREFLTDMVAEGSLDMETAAKELGFADPDEFELYVEAARDALPDDSAIRDAFDKGVQNAKSAEDVSNLLERLMSKYGDTLSAHFMFIDYGGKEGIWIPVEKKTTIRTLKSVAQDVKIRGIVFDDAIVKLLTHRLFIKWLDKNVDSLKKIGDQPETIEDLV